MMSNVINLDGQLARIRTWQIDEAQIRAEFDADGFLLLSVKLADSMHDECDLKLDAINAEKLCSWLRHRLNERWDAVRDIPMTEEEVRAWTKTLPVSKGSPVPAKSWTSPCPGQVISKDVITTASRKPWSGPHFPDGRNGYCDDPDCRRCNGFLFGTRIATPLNQQ